MRKRNRHSKSTQPAVDSQAVTLAVGDCIIVKPGIKDPELGIVMGGWQGRVSEIESDLPGKMLITFQWDSLTLKQMPASVIRCCEENGLDWTSMRLGMEDIERAETRDTQDDVDALIKELSTEHDWDHLGEQGQRIRQVLSEVDRDDNSEAFEAWREYLEAHLKLPFEAIISEFLDFGPFQPDLQIDDRVMVTGFQGVEDRCGVMVNITVGHSAYVFPLCDLNAENEKSTNYILTDDYAVWFSNH